MTYKFAKETKGFSFQIDNGPKRSWNSNAIVTCIVIEDGDSNPDDVIEFEIASPHYVRALDLTGNTLTINGVDVTANGAAAICNQLRDTVFPDAAATALSTLTTTDPASNSSTEVMTASAVQSAITTGVAATGTGYAAKYPWNYGNTFTGVAANTIKAVIDIEVIGGDKNWRVVPYTLQRYTGGDHYIRLAVLDENDVLLTSVGSSGIIAKWRMNPYTEPAAVNGRIIETLQCQNVYGGVTSAKVTIDWSLLTPNTPLGVQSYLKGGLDQRIFKSVIPKAEEKIWARENGFALANMRELVLDAKIYGVTDKTKRYGIEILRYQPTTGRSFIGVCEYSSTGVKGSRVAIWDNSSYTPPAATNGKQIDTLTLSPSNSSGISISLTVDWAQLPLSGPFWLSTYWYTDTFTVTDGEFSVNAFTSGGKIKQKGSFDTAFTLSGVSARVVTSTGYDSDGTPDHLMLILHGNGQTPANCDPSATFKTFAKANKISWASILLQDQSTAPYSTEAAGWGNRITLQRVTDLYNYLMDKYNFNRSVILSGQSMGGLTVGHLAYSQPFPIRFCLGIGPVPSLKYIFDNGGTTRQTAIRAAYLMAADGSNDAAIDTYIQGYDWYSKSLLDIGGVKYKPFGPHLYIFAGTGDTTFTTDFGGTAKYTELKNAINAAGGYCYYEEKAAVIHADPSLYDRALVYGGYTNGVFTKELGI